MVITWTTLHNISDKAEVEYGETAIFRYSAFAEITPFMDNAHFYTYRALLTRLQPNFTYC